MIFYLFFLSLLCSSSITLSEHVPAYAAGWWTGENQHYHIGLRHIESGGIGYDNGYTTVDGFVAPTPSISNVIPFLDLRAHVFNTGNFAGNIGVGLRKIIGQRIYGVNGYYDYRNCQHVNYNQMSFGIETLGKRIDFRVNAYLPIEKNVTILADPVFAKFSGQNVLLTQDVQFAMQGMNTNLGLHFGSNKICDFYACAGTYFYAGQIASHIWGGKASLQVRFKKCLTIEISNSYDKMFFNRFQVSVGLNIPLGKSCMESIDDRYDDDHDFELLLSRATQPVQRQEIVVLGQDDSPTIALDSSTGQPIRFIFVDNTSNSAGTYESPYHSLIQAQENSQPGDIIYVYPGDGTMQGMNAGITLQKNQKFWGSGTHHILPTSQGNLQIPVQSSTMPKITNTDIDTLGNAINVSSVNEVSGFAIIDALNDSIFGSNIEKLSVNHCIFQNSTTYTIEASFADRAILNVTHNSMENNVNGAFFSFSGPSSVLISDNNVTGTTSVSSVPFEIFSDTNSLSATITNNTISNNQTGAFRFGLHDTDAQIIITDNKIMNNTTGSQSSLGSPLVINTNDTTHGNCQLQLANNEFLNNLGYPVYFHTAGAFNNLQVTAADNTMIGNGGGFAFATSSNNFTLVANHNVISNVTDNALSIIADSIPTADITIAHNQMTGIINASNGIAINYGGGIDLTANITNNSISDTQGTGILMYPTTPIENIRITIANNNISNNQNQSINAAGGIDLEQFTNMLATLTNNSLSGNGDIGVYIGSTASVPVAQVQMNGNTNDTSYLFTNPLDGTFDLGPCDVETANSGTISTSGTITLVTQCPDGELCPA